MLYRKVDKLVRVQCLRCPLALQAEFNIMATINSFFSLFLSSFSPIRLLFSQKRLSKGSEILHAAHSYQNSDPQVHFTQHYDLFWGE